MGAPDTIYIYVYPDDFTMGFSTEVFSTLSRKIYFYKIKENLPAYKIMDWLSNGIEDCEDFKLVKKEK